MPRIGIWCEAFFLAKHLQVSDNHRIFAGNYLRNIKMESDKPTIEELITTVLIDIQQKGFSAVK